MQQYLKVSINRTVIRAVAVLLLIVITGVGLSYPSFWQEIKAFVVSTKPKSTSAVATEVANQVIIYSTISGFEPKELTVKAGTTQVMIRNRTGMDNLSYNLTQKVGANGQTSLFSGAVKLGSNARPTVNLGAGLVVLTEATHPKWECRINVMP